MLFVPHAIPVDGGYASKLCFVTRLKKIIQKKKKKKRKKRAPASR